MLDEGIEPAELRGMLRMRAAELEDACPTTDRTLIVYAENSA
jgi:hypothetical protein